MMSNSDDLYYKANKPLTLGELISILKSLEPEQQELVKEFGHESTIIFDFDSLYPTGLHSWRGAYNELAFDYGDDYNPLYYYDFLSMLEDAIGQTFLGWSGGEYVANLNTCLWVSREENDAPTAVVGVKNNVLNIVLLTKYID